MEPSKRNTLTDLFGRRHSYLRISITDQCNLRCLYCMPDNRVECAGSSQLMQADEIEEIAAEFVRQGVTKIRLTGGEPLVRRDAAAIMESLARHPVELTLTTNGVLVHRFIQVFKDAGIRSLNVSLDSLQETKFEEITKRPAWTKVWNNIHLLMDEGFHVKVNVVVMKGVNDGEIHRFVEWTRYRPLHVRFIEFMPFGGNSWDRGRMISGARLLTELSGRYSIVKLRDEKHETAKKYQVDGFEGTFAFINSMSEPFCGDCNRMRLTADGKMKNCLFSQGEADILGALRRGEDIVPVIQNCLMQKSSERGGQFDHGPGKLGWVHNRSMVSIGG